MNPFTDTEEILSAAETRLLEKEEVFSSVCFTIFIVLEGQLKIRAGKETWPADCIGGRMESAVLIPSPPCRIALLKLRPSGICGLLGQIPDFSGIRADLSPADKTRLRLLLPDLLEERTSPGCSSLRRTAAILSLIDLFFASSDGSWPVPDPQAPMNERKTFLYKSLYRYIAANSSLPLKQPEVAARFFVTPQYAGQLLREGCRMSFKDLLLSLRKEREGRLDLLLRREEQDTSALPGIPAAPGPRESEPPTPVPAPSLHSFKIRTSASAPIRESSVSFRKLITLGYASSLRTLELNKTLKIIQKEIGFVYGRICRITDLIFEYPDGSLYYPDYRQVFRILDTLSEYRMIPFLELGNKAMMIHENVSNSFKTQESSDPAAYYERLLLVLPGFLRSAVNHYGQEYFDQWYFELSYMYTDAHEAKIFPFTEYLKVFQRLYRLIRSFSSSCKIGGPGFNDWTKDSRLLRTTDLMKSHHAVPDFFSIYLYPVAFDTNSQILSLDPVLALERLKKTRAYLESRLPGVPLWITEFNSSLSSRNLLNDTHYQAIWLTWMIMAASKEGAAGLGYYLLSDAPLHYMNSLEFLFGGWGLFSGQNIPKPSFYACQLLSRLGHYVIYQGESCVITENSKGSIQILLFRYSRPDPDYIRSNIQRETLLRNREIFLDPGTDHYEIEIRSVLKGVYIQKEYRIDWEHANLFAAWKNMDFLMPRDELTLTELMQQACPVPEVSIRKIRSGESFHALFRLQDVSMCLCTLELYTSHVEDY